MKTLLKKITSAAALISAVAVIIAVVQYVVNQPISHLHLR